MPVSHMARRRADEGELSMLSQLVIVRRYVDMNGRYIGELYLNGTMIGASQDNLPLEYDGKPWFLDTWRSFLSPLTWRTVRVGGTAPDNDKATRRKVRWLRPFSLRLRVENNFVTDQTRSMETK